MRFGRVGAIFQADTKQAAPHPLRPEIPIWVVYLILHYRRKYTASSLQPIPPSQKIKAALDACPEIPQPERRMGEKQVEPNTWVGSGGGGRQVRVRPGFQVGNGSGARQEAREPGLGVPVRPSTPPSPTSPPNSPPPWLTKPAVLYVLTPLPARGGERQQWSHPCLL